MVFFIIMSCAQQRKRHLTSERQRHNKNTNSKDFFPEANAVKGPWEFGIFFLLCLFLSYVSISHGQETTTKRKKVDS
jgi:hypothetical protein